VADFATRLRDLIDPLPGHTSLNDGGWMDRDWWLPIQLTTAADSIFLAASDLKELHALIGFRLAGANGHPVETIAQAMQAHVRYENRLGVLSGVANVVRSRKFMLDLFAGDDPEQIIFQLQGRTAQSSSEVSRGRSGGSSIRTNASVRSLVGPRFRLPANLFSPPF